MRPKVCTPCLPLKIGLNFYGYSDVRPGLFRNLGLITNPNVMLKALMLLLVSATCLRAQIAGGNDHGATLGSNAVDHLMLLQARKFTDPETPEPIDGTPYMVDAFEKGSIVTTKGLYTEIPIRYNIDGDYIEFKKQEVVYILDPSLSVKKVSLPSADLIVDNYVSKGKSKQAFYVLLDSGRLTLLKKKKVLFHPAQAPKAVETDGRHARYEKLSDDYFFKLDGGPVVEFSSVKKILEVLPDHKEEVKNFVNEENISKKERDLIKLAKYYNQLQ